MPKVLWVVLPLLLALVLLAALAWRGRAPSRRAVNIVSSVLLLGYVGATAGLGIFWVANQQLPVFDWHYLFGYGTLLLLALHLVFNLPVVWRFFRTRQRTAPARPATHAGPGRRGWLLALGGGAVASGVAFVAGRHQGRQQGRDEALAAAAPLPQHRPGVEPPGLALVRRFHDATAHRQGGLLRPAPGIDWGDAPVPFRQWPQAPRTALPAPGSGRPGGADLAAIADLLWHAAGVTEERGGLLLRASPSSGALFSTELYLLVDHWPGLAPGVWHHQARDHVLERLGAWPAAGVAPSAAIVATAVFGRTGRKYGERTYRYVLADLGHLLENLRLVAGELQLPVRLLADADEAALTRQWPLDPAAEGVLAVVQLGAAPTALADVREPRTDAAAPAGPPGLTGEVHRASSHRERGLVAALPVPVPPTRTTGPALALPRPALAAAAWRPLIARRRSVRRYADDPLPLPALAAVLLRMAATAPLLSPAVRIDVVAHAVGGLAPGAYRYDAPHHTLHRRRPGAPRAASRRAALGQDVVGDAAAVCVLSIDLAAFAADPLGPARGYRHAFLEAGLVGERAYLEAALQGLGVCAVGAFYDDDAAALVGLAPAQEWPVHFIALGPVRPTSSSAAPRPSP